MTGDPLECLDDPRDCAGPVELHWNGDPEGRTWPRCAKHQDLRTEARENSIEQYANSDIAPAWFSPEDIGEVWSEDDY